MRFELSHAAAQWQRASTQGSRVIGVWGHGRPISEHLVEIQTEHPKLLIFETRLGNSFLENKRLEVQNMDIFSYVNSKFVYVEKHIRIEITRLYHDVLTQRCLLE